MASWDGVWMNERVGVRIESDGNCCVQESSMLRETEEGWS